MEGARGWSDGIHLPYSRMSVFANPSHSETVREEREGERARESQQARRDRLHSVLQSPSSMEAGKQRRRQAVRVHEADVDGGSNRILPTSPPPFLSSPSICALCPLLP